MRARRLRRIIGIHVMAIATRTVRAAHATAPSCNGWPQEAALMMLMNNLETGYPEALAAAARGDLRMPMREERAC
jgi:hypothetical protein